MADNRNRSCQITAEGIKLIEKLRMERGWNKSQLQEYLIDKTKIESIARILRIKRGEKNTIDLIATALDISPTDLVDEKEWFGLPESRETKASVVNWRSVSKGMLDNLKRLTTEALTAGDGIRFDFDDVFVPLGVVERREKTKRKEEDGAPDRGSELYEEKVTPITHKDFFEDVFLRGNTRYSNGKRIAVIGEAGAGKTTQLQKIGSWLLEESDDIPIWISLTDLGTIPLEEFIFENWVRNASVKRTAPQEWKDSLEDAIASGKVWLLLDGVDEMTVSNPLSHLSTQLNESWLKNVRVVLTCRVNVWDGGKNALTGFDVYRNLDFDYPDDVYKFIGKWFVRDPELAGSLTQALEQSGKERIRDMVKNPLRLTLLCYSWQLKQGELPETKAGLYEWFVEAFYKWNKGKAQIELSRSQEEQLNRALGELAKRAIDGGNSRFRLTKTFIENVFREFDIDLFDLALKLNWLNEIGVAAENPLETVYAFYHPSFQEYFAALAINDWDFFLPNNHIDNPAKDNFGNYKKYRVFEVQWEEVILIWLGNKNLNQQIKAIYLLLKFVDGCQGFYLNRSVIIFTLCSVSIISYTPKILSHSIISLLIRSYSNSLVIKSNIFKKINPKLLLEYIHETTFKKLEDKEIFRLGRPCSDTRILFESLDLDHKKDYKLAALGRDAIAQIDPYNEQLFDILVNEMATPQFFVIDHPVEQIDDSIEGIVLKSEKLAKKLSCCLNSTNPFLKYGAAHSLLSHKDYRVICLEIMLEEAKNSSEWHYSILIAERILEVIPNNLEIINILEQSIEKSNDYHEITWIALMLIENNPLNQKAIDIIVGFLENYLSCEDNIDCEIERAIYDSLIICKSIDCFKGQLGKIFVDLIGESKNLFVVLLSAKILYSIYDRPQHNHMFARLTILNFLEHSKSLDIWIDTVEFLILEGIESDSDNALQTLLQKTTSFNLDEFDFENLDDYVYINKLNYIDKNADEFYKISAVLRNITYEISYKNCLKIVNAIRLITRNHLDSLMSLNYFQFLRDSLFNCAQKINYPDFYEAWHSQTTSTHPKIADIISSNNTNKIQILEGQLVDCEAIQKELDRNTDHPKIRCLVIDVRHLEQESDPNVIAKKLTNKIFNSIGRRIPVVQDVSCLERELLNLKFELGFDKFAIALYGKSANEAINQLCQNLAPIQTRLFTGEQTTEELITKINAWLSEM